jgi:C1A family cysteine protease
MRKNYGWLADRPDPRDLYYADVHSPLALARKFGIVVNPHIDVQNPIVPVTPIHANPVGLGTDGLPLSVSLRSEMPAVFDQSTLGACVAHSTCAMFQFAHGATKTIEQNYSRLSLYYQARLMEGTQNSDSGCINRDAISVCAQKGVGLEIDFPYDVTKYMIAPPQKELEEGLENKAIEYSRLVSRSDFRNCLAQGHPFIVGITIFGSFESNEVAKTGIVPMPQYGEQMLGGHSVCVVGYDNNYKSMGEYYEVRNSWGPNWGDQGYFWLPAAYLEPTGNNQNLASDFWCIRR